jgi:hypothetical protein
MTAARRSCSPSGEYTLFDAILARGAGPGRCRFDDERVVAWAGLPRPATLAERLGIQAQALR